MVLLVIETRLIWKELNSIQIFNIFTISTQSGIILYTYNEPETSILNLFISQILLKNKNTSQSTVTSQTIQYQMDNEFQLLFFLIHPSVVQLEYAQDLLSTIKQEFTSRFGVELASRLANLDFQTSFHPIFENILQEIEMNSKQVCI